MPSTNYSSEIRLTEFSHGAGCGCKLSPGVLSEILGPESSDIMFDNLLVGNSTKDDAAVIDLDGKTAIVSTTDFFMPIVDDPADFGAIAATNAISDIYAMGAEPIMAIAILGWPIDKIPAEVAGIVLSGAREKCYEAGIPLAGGHSIDTPEPVFGLAVTGKARTADIKKNSSAKQGDVLYLTKPLGIGITTTAQKQKKVIEEDFDLARHTMLQLNKVGSKIGVLPYVHAVTDVTGFGLAGHLLEVCEGSGLKANIYFDKVPRYHFIEKYIKAGCVPGGTGRNLATYGEKITTAREEYLTLLADPQTSGGLLIAVDPLRTSDFESELKQFGQEIWKIGEMLEYKSGDRINIL